ncbi:MAG: hypothetical protein QXI39_00445 [Candidatus Bathyarchaeia archaeon]
MPKVPREYEDVDRETYIRKATEGLIAVTMGGSQGVQVYIYAIFFQYKIFI